MLRTCVLTGTALPPLDLQTVRKDQLKVKLGPHARDVNASLELVYWRAETLPDTKDEAVADSGCEGGAVSDELVIIYDRSLELHASSKSSADVPADSSELDK